MTKTHRLTDFIERLKQVREEEGDLVLIRPSINAHNESITKLVNIDMNGTETLYEDTNKE